MSQYTAMISLTLSDATIKRPVFRAMSFVILILFQTLHMAWSQDSSQVARANPPAGYHYAVMASSHYQMPTALDGGGKLSLFQTGLNASLGYQTPSSNRVALSVGYQERGYDFDGVSLLAGASPWERIHFLSISLPTSLQLAPEWKALMIPTLRTMVEDFGDTEQNLTGGGIAGVSYQINPRLKLGPGLGVLSQLEDSISVFPVILVDWTISDHWRLSTGRGTGASQGPGLTLTYDLNRSWNLMLSGRYDRFRFRTHETGLIAHGVGEDKSASIYLTASYAYSPKVQLDLFAGCHVAGSLSMADSSGSTISERDYQVAPVLGFNFGMRF